MGAVTRGGPKGGARKPVGGWERGEVALARRVMRSVHDALGTRPGQEEAWMATVQRRDPRLYAQLAREAYRPLRPTAWQADPNYWLNSDDIAAVMRQYEGHKGFRFVGVFPRDFATRGSDNRCVSTPMCALHVATLRAAGTPRAGIVFNMDKHTQRGAHWAGCYMCVDPKDARRFGVWYYDSLANPPPREIAAFMTRIRDEALAAFGPKVGGRFKCEANRVQRQFQNTECGIYSCLFLVACLTTARTFGEICGKVMKRDAAVARLRHVFFR